MFFLQYKLKKLFIILSSFYLLRNTPTFSPALLPHKTKLWKMFDIFTTFFPFPSNRIIPWFVRLRTVQCLQLIILYNHNQISLFSLKKIHFILSSPIRIFTDNILYKFSLDMPALLRPPLCHHLVFTYNAQAYFLSVLFGYLRRRPRAFSLINILNLRSKNVRFISNLCKT